MWNCASNSYTVDRHETKPNVPRRARLIVRSNSRKKGSTKLSSISHNSSEKRQRSISAELNKSQHSKRNRRKANSNSRSRGTNSYLTSSVSRLARDVNQNYYSTRLKLTHPIQSPISGVNSQYPSGHNSVSDRMSLKPPLTAPVEMNILSPPDRGTFISTEKGSNTSK